MSELLLLVHDYLIGDLGLDDLVELVAWEADTYSGQETSWSQRSPEEQAAWIVQMYREGLINERTVRAGLILVSGLATVTLMAEPDAKQVRSSGAVPIRDSKVYYA